MNKTKLFLSNFFVYGVGGIISKFIPIIMVPIITRIIPEAQYFGLSDMTTTIISLFSAFAIMGMYDAMYRMFFEKENDLEYKKEICSTALWFTIFSSFIIFVLMLIFKNVITKFFLEDQKYSFLIYLSAMAVFTGATNSIISAPTRMQNKYGLFLITNTLGPILSYTICIPMLLKGDYVLSLPLSGLISGVVIEVIFFIANRKWFSVKHFKLKHLKPLLLIALPLLPNSLLYWVFNSSDKVMITNMIGMSATGIYSVSSKIGHISQLIYVAFAGGWQFFAFSIMRENDQVKTNSKIFEYLGALSFISSIFIFSLSEPMFKILFTEEYYEGFISGTYLFLAPLLLMLYQVAANQFLVIKKTWPSFLILSLGAVANIILNIFLIPVLGIEGASIATLASYAISVLVCVIVLSKMKLMKLDLRFYIITLITIAYILIWRFLTLNIIWLNIVLAIVFSCVIALFYLNDIKLFFKTLKRKKEEKDDSQETEQPEEVSEEEPKQELGLEEKSE